MKICFGAIITQLNKTKQQDVWSLIGLVYSEFQQSRFNERLFYKLLLLYCREVWSSCNRQLPLTADRWINQNFFFKSQEAGGFTQSRGDLFVDIWVWIKRCVYMVKRQRTTEIKLEIVVFLKEDEGNVHFGCQTPCINLKPKPKHAQTFHCTWFPVS